MAADEPGARDTAEVERTEGFALDPAVVRAAEETAVSEELGIDAIPAGDGMGTDSGEVEAGGGALLLVRGGFAGAELAGGAVGPGTLSAGCVLLAPPTCAWLTFTFEVFFQNARTDCPPFASM